MKSYSVVEILGHGNKTVNIQAIYIYDLLGNQLLHEAEVDLRQFYLTKNMLTTGCYFVKAIGENEKEYLGKLLITLSD